MKYLLQTQIGIEKITELELEQKFKGKYSLDYSGYVPHKNGIVQIDWKDDKNLGFYTELGTIEDAFLVLDYVKNIPQTATLKSIYQKLDHEKIRKNFDYFFDKVNTFDNSKKVRFVTRKKAPNEFRRIDLENSIKDFFTKKINRAEVTVEEGVKEIWTTLVKNRLILTVRLTTKEMRQSYYKTAMVSGTLRPSVSYALAFLSELHSKDSIWDPFCGAGTIGCEISDNYKFGKLLFGDISEESLNAARVNFSNLKTFKQNKGKVSFRHEDFFGSKNYATLLISNLPFGNKYFAGDDFVQRFFDKVNSIPRIKKLAVLYPEILENRKWQLTRRFEIQLLGYPVWMQVLQKLD